MAGPFLGLDGPGQPLAHTEVAILDTVSNAILPLHAIGEICARGYMLMREYDDNPEATQAAIDADFGLPQQQLAHHALAHLSPQKKPQQWIAVTEWPLTGSGIIHKFRLREQFEAGEFAIKGSE